MANEARILASGRSEESPPRRHGDRRDDPEFRPEHGFDSILGALCVSVVQNSDLKLCRTKPIWRGNG